MIKFYPSSATFTVGLENNADWPSQCHRALFLQAHDIRRPDDATFASKDAGADFERRVGQWLDEEFELPQVHAERGLTVFAPDDGWLSNGRADYLIDHKPHRIVAECKATRSAGTAADFRAGRVKHYHLAQLLIYMVAAKTCAGRIYCGVYKKDNDENNKPVLSYHRIYYVCLEPDGTIYVDGTLFEYRIGELFNSYDVVAAHYYNDTVPNRPMNYNNVWKSPCLKCPFSEACDNYEDTGDFASYLTECASLTQSKGTENV